MSFIQTLRLANWFISCRTPDNSSTNNSSFCLNCPLILRPPYLFSLIKRSAKINFRHELKIVSWIVSNIDFTPFYTVSDLINDIIFCMSQYFDSNTLSFSTKFESNWAQMIFYSFYSPSCCFEIIFNFFHNFFSIFSHFVVRVYKDNVSL